MKKNIDTRKLSEEMSGSHWLFNLVREINEKGILLKLTRGKFFRNIPSLTSLHPIDSFNMLIDNPKHIFLIKQVKIKAIYPDE